MSTDAEVIREMMVAWAKIEAAVRQRFPRASEEAVYQITARAMRDAVVAAGAKACHGYSPNALKHALVKPYPRAEALIAEAIGIPPQQIWPSRYHPDGTPIQRGRARRKPSSKSTSAPDGCHVNVGDGA